MEPVEGLAGQSSTVVVPDFHFLVKIILLYCQEKLGKVGKTSKEKVVLYRDAENPNGFVRLRHDSFTTVGSVAPETSCQQYNRGTTIRIPG